MSVVITIIILLLGLRILMKLVVWIEKLIWSPVTEDDWHRQQAEDVLTWLLMCEAKEQVLTKRYMKVFKS